MKLFKSTVLVTSLILLLAACNGRLAEERSISPQNKEEEEINKIPQSDQTADTTQAPPSVPKPQTATNANSESKVDWDKKIIKTATINLEVKNYKSFSDLTKEKIKKLGGYVAQEEQNQTDYKVENIITIKVPVDQFNNLVTELTKGEEKIIEKKITSEDVTTAIVDTKSRMEAKKQVRLRYLDLLKQARNMQEILNVQNEINGIQEDIEAATGRIEYLSRSSAYSTINLTYFEVLDATAKNGADVSYGTKVWQSFKNGWSWIGDIFVGIISIWPLFLLAFICWFAYKRWSLAKTQKRNA
ncbi:MAG TPA: DUF4349 domain-containing protein [Chitinophagaceae bacterium]|jgi:hypothetical protein|nr:DUF4349 domain-containing protein [Chitinophagaceae bacterium]